MSDDTTRVTTATSAIFTTYEQDRLDQIQRFFVHACDPDIAPILAHAGFDAAELELGWKDWDIAVGRTIPFNLHLIAQQRGDLVGLSEEQQARLSQLDRFENAWFPRVRNAIRRFVVKDQRETFEAAFFQDLRQEPLGPGVIRSVGGLLDRLDSTENSAVPGVKETFAALRKKGLSDALRKEMRGFVAAARKAFEPGSGSPAEVEQIRLAAEERREAYERVNAWYIDWADTVRTSLTYHQAVRLGVTASKGGSRPAVEDETPANPPTGPVGPIG